MTVHIHGGDIPFDLSVCPKVTLADTLPGLRTKVRDLNGQGSFFALVWKDCECFDPDITGDFKSNQKNFFCPVHMQGETNRDDHCYCGYGEQTSVLVPCQIHAAHPRSADELELLQMHEAFPEGYRFYEEDVNHQAVESPAKDVIYD